MHPSICVNEDENKTKQSFKNQEIVLQTTEMQQCTKGTKPELFQQNMYPYYHSLLVIYLFVKSFSYLFLNFSELYWKDENKYDQIKNKA